MHAVFFVSSPVSWETNVTKFSEFFIHKLLYDAVKNSVKMKEKKQIENKGKTGRSFLNIFRIKTILKRKIRFIVLQA